MKRILTAIVLILAVLVLLLYGQLWMITLCAALVAGLAAYEFLQLANAGAPGHSTTTHIPAWWMSLSVVILFLVTFYRPNEMLPAIAALMLLLFIRSGLRAPLNRVLLDTAAGLFGLIYVVYPLTLLPLLWMQEDGTVLLIFLMVCVWAGDIAALYIGRAFGRHKLAPRLSPAKTWEGSIASIAGTLLAAYAVVLLGDLLTSRGNTLLHITEPLWQTLVLAAVLNLAAQLGDLLESAIKRGAGVKDSGMLLPGHGGILDRIDALLFAAPVLWFALLLKDAFGFVRF